jgi:hypothetical protein
MYYFLQLFHSYSTILYESDVIHVFNWVMPLLINNLQLCKGVYELLTRQNKIKTCNVILHDTWSFACHISFTLSDYFKSGSLFFFFFFCIFCSRILLNLTLLRGFWYYYCCCYIIYSSQKLVKLTGAGCIVCVTIHIKKCLIYSNCT